MRPTYANECVDEMEEKFMISTIRDILFDNPKIDPDHIALISDHSRMTYQELRAAVARVATALCSEGVVVGDRVSVLLENVNEYVISYFAITSIGAIYVPLNWRLHPSEHVILMRNSEPKVAIISSAFAESVQAVLEDVPSLKRVVTVGKSLPGSVDFETWSSVAAELPAAQVPKPEDGAVIVYTSGTTGLPKGVLLSQQAVVFDIHNVAIYGKQTNESTVVHVSPFYHQTFVHVLVHLAFGGTAVLMKKFDPGAVMSVIEKNKATYIMLAPTMLYDLLDHPKRSEFDLSTLKTIVYGAAPITGARLRSAIDVLGQTLVNAYGLTEATSHVSYLSKEDHLAAEGSIGRGIRGIDVRIVDDDCNDVPAGGVGEIIVRGPTVMMEYWRAPETTAETIVNGWLHSGDLAKIDDRGFMYVVDRKKDLVISGGVNIYPRDIECVLAECPGVADAAAFGVPDPYWGEALAGAVVPKVGVELDPDFVQKFCRTRLGGYQVPKKIFVLTELPKNATGKILKRELRKRFT